MTRRKLAVLLLITHLCSDYVSSAAILTSGITNLSKNVDVRPAFNSDSSACPAYSPSFPHLPSRELRSVYEIAISLTVTFKNSEIGGKLLMYNMHTQEEKYSAVHVKWVIASPGFCNYTRGIIQG